MFLFLSESIKLTKPILCERITNELTPDFRHRWCVKSKFVESETLMRTELKNTELLMHEAMQIHVGGNRVKLEPSSRWKRRSEDLLT